MDNYHDTGHRLRIHDKRQRAQGSDSVGAAVRPTMKQDDIANAKEWSAQTPADGEGWRPVIGRLANRVKELERENARLLKRFACMENAVSQILADSSPEQCKRYQGFIDRAEVYSSNARDDRQLPGHTQPRNQTPTG